MKKRALVKNHEYFTTVHAFVRMMLLNHDFEEAYEKLRSICFRCMQAHSKEVQGCLI